MDLTCQFPYQSSRGHKYILTIYDYDSNAILVEPLKNRKAETITAAWKKKIKLLEKQGIQPKIFIMDNEASDDLKSALTKANYDLQLVPPDNHRANAAERAIQTFKAHFLAGISSLPLDFPLSEWDYLLEQAELTLLLLRSSRTNPNLSSYAYLNGNFDFNKTPLAPPETKTIIHNRPNSRPSWGFHGDEAFYIGPALQHYRCIKCYVPSTKSTRISDTVAFIPTTVPIPVTSIDDHLCQAAGDIVTILQNPPKSQFPSLHLGDKTQQAIQAIAELLNRAAPSPPPFNNPPSIKIVKWKSPLTSILFIPKLGTKSCKHSKPDNVPLPRVLNPDTTSSLPRVHHPKKSKTSINMSPKLYERVSIPTRRSERLRNKLGPPKSQIPSFSIPVAVPISYSSDSPRACKQLQPRVTWHSAALKAK